MRYRIFCLWLLVGGLGLGSNVLAGISLGAMEGEIIQVKGPKFTPKNVPFIRGEFSGTLAVLLVDRKQVADWVSEVKQLKLTLASFPKQKKHRVLILMGEVGEMQLNIPFKGFVTPDFLKKKGEYAEAIVFVPDIKVHGAPFKEPLALITKLFVDDPMLVKLAPPEFRDNKKLGIISHTDLSYIMKIGGKEVLNAQLGTIEADEIDTRDSEFGSMRKLLKQKVMVATTTAVNFYDFNFIHPGMKVDPRPAVLKVGRGFVGNRQAISQELRPLDGDNPFGSFSFETEWEMRHVGILELRSIPKEQGER